MRVGELIVLLSKYNPELPVCICADNGTPDDPSDLYAVAIRAVDNGGPNMDGTDVIAIWCNWGTSIDTDIDAPLW